MKTNGRNAKRAIVGAVAALTTVISGQAHAQMLGNACQTPFGTAFGPLNPIGTPCFVIGTGHVGHVVYVPQGVHVPQQVPGMPMARPESFPLPTAQLPQQQPNQVRLPMPTQLPPDGARIAACLKATGGNAMACGAAEFANELDKCKNGIGVPGGCFGPNGEIAKIIRNAEKDLKEGPGPCNFIRNPLGVGC